MLRRSKRLTLPRREEIIPNLPDDIAWNCLLRVPYKWHSTLKRVCRKWKEIMSDPKFYKDRMTTGTAEKLICMIKYFTHGSGIVLLDPVTRTWEILYSTIQNIPNCECVCVNGKLVLIGGSVNMKAVYIFDFASAKWSRGTDMPTKRHNFACSVSSSTGLIYVAGGRSGQTVVGAAEAYNVEEDRWQILPPMTQPRGSCRGVFLTEKFFVFGAEYGKNAEIFDPKTGVWTRVDNMWRFERSFNGNNVRFFDPKTGLWARLDNMWRFEESFKLSCIVVSGHLYTSTKTQLMKYNVEENDWVMESVLPTKFPKITCTAEWRGHIFASKPSARGSRRQFCYLLNPSTNESIEFQVPENCVGITMSTATVEI